MRMGELDHATRQSQMRRALIALTVVLFTSASPAQAGWFLQPSLSPSTPAPLGAETEPPPAYYDFCMEHLSICDNEDRAPNPIAMSPENLKKIQTLNLDVNKTISQVSDMTHYKIAEKWQIPIDGAGDCEDISILKRQLLIKQGFPIPALLLTLVNAPQEGNHVILTLKSDQGDYILDNLTDEILPWSATPYKFIKRQSEYQQNIWVFIKDERRLLSYRDMQVDRPSAGVAKKKSRNGILANKKTAYDYSKLSDRQCSYRKPPKKQ